MIIKICGNSTVIISTNYIIRQDRYDKQDFSFGIRQDRYDIQDFSFGKDRTDMINRTVVLV